MPDARPAKKTSPPDVEAPPRTGGSSDAEARMAPHELFWEAGQRLFQALQRGGEEARNKLASAWQEQQQHLWDVHSEAHKRAEDLRHEYWSALNQATGEDRARAWQEATQRYHDGLWEIQSSLRKEWETAAANFQGTFRSLAEGFEGTRLTAFNGYKHACQRAWSEIDPNTLTCESLATIGHSLLASAHVVGGRPHVS
jgi:hypothetical protein